MASTRTHPTGRARRSAGRPQRAAVRCLGLVLVASLAALLSQGAACFASVRGRAGASQQLVQRSPSVARHVLTTDDTRQLDESERVSGGEIVKGFVAGSVLAIGTLAFGALAISGAIVPAPVGLAIVLAAVIAVIYASLKGAKQNSGEEVDWASGKDIKSSNEVVFAWPWLKKGERSKAGPLSFF
mmetsp:Transcript_4778/g.12834  ORF Transcript_4778/g.12834 Transcript_4778/m.12834 type:complete len:185 (-) Transcript_4778:85-639(-)